MSEQWVVEWSQKSNNLHVQRLDWAMKDEQERFLHDKPVVNDYVIIHVGEDADAAHRFAESIRETIHKRDVERRARDEIDSSDT